MVFSVFAALRVSCSHGYIFFLGQHISPGQTSLLVSWLPYCYWVSLCTCHCGRPTRPIPATIEAILHKVPPASFSSLLSGVSSNSMHWLHWQSWPLFASSSNVMQYCIPSLFCLSKVFWMMWLSWHFIPKCKMISDRQCHSRAQYATLQEDWISMWKNVF